MKTKRSKATDIPQSVKEKVWQRDNEIWKPVFGYENYYEVSNKGNVRSIGNFQMCNGGKRPICCLNKNVHKQGYLSVRLYKDKKQKTFFVHRLVAKAFIPEQKEKLFVNHIDGNKSNNNVENLEWCSRSENIMHAYKNRLNKQSIIVNVIDKKTNQKYKFVSYAQASTFIKQNIAYISARLKENIYENKNYKWEKKDG